MKKKRKTLLLDDATDEMVTKHNANIKALIAHCNENIATTTKISENASTYFILFFTTREGSTEVDKLSGGAWNMFSLEALSNITLEFVIEMANSYMGAVERELAR